MIEVQGLSKYYGSRCAVDNISFSVESGTIFGFLGPNGAGKTTTIRILTGYMPPSSGRAQVAGYDVVSQSMEVRRVVGYLPESVPLYPEMRTREYLDFRGKLRGLDKPGRRSAIERVTERCWLRDVIDRPVGQLSKGYRQRVGLADTLLHNPKVLILDEPTVGLDPTQVRETRSLLRELAIDHPILFSSHTLSEVEAICHRILILYEGRIIAQGPVAELKEQVAGRRRVQAEIKAPEAELKSAVENLSGVAAVQTRANGEWTRLDMEAEPAGREAITSLAHERGWPVRELYSQQATFEDFFVQAIVNARSGQAASAAS